MTAVIAPNSIYWSRPPSPANPPDDDGDDNDDEDDEDEDEEDDDDIMGREHVVSVQ